MDGFNLNDSQETQFENAPAAYHMRCPKCKKLYSAAGLTVRSASTPLKFECLSPSCKTRYFATLVDPASIEGMITYEAGDGIDMVVPQTTPPSISSQSQRRAEPVVAEKAPMISDLRCPKCGTRNQVSSSECRSCGIVFAKAKKEKPEAEGLSGEISLAGRRELSDLWDAILDNYEDQAKHDRFVKACHEAGCLPYASMKYTKILSAAPQEEIARNMRKRVVAIAGVKAEVAPKPTLKFRIPKLNNLILILGSMAMTMGFILPGFKNLAGLGIAAVALAIGVRFFLRPRT